MTTADLIEDAQTDFAVALADATMKMRAWMASPGFYSAEAGDTEAIAAYDALTAEDHAARHAAATEYGKAERRLHLVLGVLVTRMAKADQT